MIAAKKIKHILFLIILVFLNQGHSFATSFFQQEGDSIKSDTSLSATPKNIIHRGVAKNATEAHLQIIEALRNMNSTANEKRSKLEQQLAKSRTYRRIAMALAGIVLVLFIYSFRRYHKYRKVNRLLSSKQRELSEALLRLEESEQKYFRQYEMMRQLIKATSDGLWEADFQTGEISFSNGVKGILGKSPTLQLDSSNSQTIIQPKDLIVLKKAIEDCKKGKTKKVNVEVRFLTNKNKTHWMRLRGKIIDPTTSGKKRMIIGIVHDIHSLKLAQKLARRHEKELEEANKAKDKFFSIIAHDLRSPFNVIIGLSDLLNHDYDNFDDDEKKEFIKKIHSASGNAFELVENLLQWSRTQNSRIYFNPVELNLNTQVDEVIKISISRAIYKNIQIETSIPKDLNIVADKNMLFTILHNLLTNAIKFSHRNKNIIISAYEKDLHVEIHISDEGVGIPEEHRDSLFRIDNEFKQPGTEKEQGTGLGLILCKEFVKKHNGHIWVKSMQGQGSDFAFRIPKQRAKSTEK